MAHLPQPNLHQYPPDLLHLTVNPPSNSMTRLPVMTEVHRNHYFRCPSPINIIANRKAWASRWCVDGKSLNTSGWCLRCRLLLWCTIEYSLFCKWNCVFQISDSDYYTRLTPNSVSVVFCNGHWSTVLCQHGLLETTRSQHFLVDCSRCTMPRLWLVQLQ
jgi:hypothetical protein